MSKEPKVKHNQVAPHGLSNEALEVSTPQCPPDSCTDSVTSVTMVTSTLRGVSKWKDYVCSRRELKGPLCFRRTPRGKENKQAYLGLAEDEDEDDERLAEQQGKAAANGLKKKLLDHFRDLAKSNKDQDWVDLQHLEKLLVDGADVNAQDKYGQTVLHEVAQSWHVDVMRFLLERKADVNKADSYGVTPLHVAAAVDYEEMVELLIQNNGTDCGVKQTGDQTPLHFAAKNDAVSAVRALCKHTADLHVRDYKQRTPIHLAADLDRSEAARVLLELGSDAGVEDSDGQTCLTAMIGRMTPVAYLALNQFQEKNRVTRKQYYYLNLIEPTPPLIDGKKSPARSPAVVGYGFFSPQLEMIVHQESLDLVMHPVVLQLIEVKWMQYGKLGTWILLLLNFLFILLWTFVAISTALVRPEDSPYVFPQDWWRVFIIVLALFLTLVNVSQELREIVHSKSKLQRWKAWCRQRINADMYCSHPMWPEERNFLEEQMRSIERMTARYFHDFCQPVQPGETPTASLCSRGKRPQPARAAGGNARAPGGNACGQPMQLGEIPTASLCSWEKHLCTRRKCPWPAHTALFFCDFRNVFDWLVYLLLLVIFGIHVADIFIINTQLRLTSLRLFAVTIIFLWLRLMKHVRAFRAMGPFIVMLGKIMDDVLRFLFLYAEFYIPYACAFWIIFGGKASIPSMETVDRLLYSLYRITLVDDYEFDLMFELDPAMAYILCGTFLGLSAILCVNLLIALLSDTFQRVYDNATANAVMQQASIILLVEDSMPWLKRFYDPDYVRNYCAPMEAFYEEDIDPKDDVNGEMKNLALQIKVG
ncbi:transient receptor potential channel pyrexia-like [Latimeria chalumnae]|uniref:transient receptor potential channel pyrexia-like n=1 Tax=Latimeria chalumnae TaxID=7897 RepID=UPI00313E3669